MALLFQDNNNELLHGVYAQLSNGYWVRVFAKDGSSANRRKFITKQEDDNRKRQERSWKEIIISKKEDNAEKESDGFAEGVQ